MSFTQCTEKIALQHLTAFDWKLELATDHYFQSPERFAVSSSHGRSSSAVDKHKLEHLFNRYKGKNDCNRR